MGLQARALEAQVSNTEADTALKGEKPTKKQAELWEKSASSSQFSSTSKDIDRLDYKGKNRESVTTNGRAAFYACMWNDFRQAAVVS